MKKLGNISEYSEEREKNLLKVYFNHLRTCKYISMPNVFNTIIRMPAERFFVSSSRATVVIAAVEHGDRLEYMRPNKRRMFYEIYKRYKALRENDSSSSISRLVGKVVSQPAPEFYISASSAKIIILKARKKWFEKKAKKRQQSF